jgi:hypothetical protein
MNGCQLLCIALPCVGLLLRPSEVAETGDRLAQKVSQASMIRVVRYFHRAPNMICWWDFVSSAHKMAEAIAEIFHERRHLLSRAVHLTNRYQKDHGMEFE